MNPSFFVDSIILDLWKRWKSYIIFTGQMHAMGQLLNPSTVNVGHILLLPYKDKKSRNFYIDWPILNQKIAKNYI